MSTTPAAPAIERLEPSRWLPLQAAVLTAAFAAVFYVVLRGLVYQWSDSANWSHGFIIPLFSIYLVYLKWDRLRGTPIRFAWLGVPVMLAGIGAYFYFAWVFPMTYGQRLAMLLTLLGVLVTLCGVLAMRWLWLPWAFLLFAIPLPQGIYFELTDPLRQMAAKVATALLNLMPGLEIETIGSTIHYYYRGHSGALGVADACSGMRSAMALAALGVAVAWMVDRPWWHRLIMVAMCVPIAIFANFIRVTVTCLLHIFVDPTYATGAYHIGLGLATLLIAFAIFSGLGWLLEHLFVEEPEAGDSDTAAA